MSRSARSAAHIASLALVLATGAAGGAIAGALPVPREAAPVIAPADELLEPGTAAQGAPSPAPAAPPTHEQAPAPHVSRSS